VKVPTGFRVAAGAVRGAMIASIVMVGLSASSCSSRTQAASNVPESRGRQFIIAVDLSGSRTNSEIAQDRELVATLVGGLRSGDQIVLRRVAGSGPQPAVPAWIQTMPAMRAALPTKAEQRRLDAAREDVRADLDELFKERGNAKIDGTDLLATIFAVRDSALEAGGRQTLLVVLSDMIQDSGGLNFERSRGIPALKWIDDQLARHLIPDLSQVCVTAVGPDSSTADGVARREFWQRYFRAAGARLEPDHYRRTITQFDSVLCRP
jgi:hypothetical protein